MKRGRRVLLGLIGLLLGSCAHEPETGRIILGRDVAEGELPFQVQIYWQTVGSGAEGDLPAWQQRHQCGGALIAPEWVVTAAHCFFPGKKARGAVTVMVDKPEWFGVRVGTRSITDAPHGGEDVDVAELVIHPGYVPCRGCPPVGGPPASPAHAQWYSHDIALVRLTQPVRINRSTQPVRLPQSGADAVEYFGRPVMASGWGLASNAEARELAALGMVREAGGNSPVRAQAEPILQLADLKIVACTGEGVLPTHFCAGGRDGADTCKGDSGGPLFVRRPQGLVLLGITSRRPFGETLCGAGTTRTRVETRYTRVAGEHAEWIADTIGPDAL